MRCENKTFLQNDPGFLQEISSTAVEVGLAGEAGLAVAGLAGVCGQLAAQGAGAGLLCGEALEGSGDCAKAGSPAKKKRMKARVCQHTEGILLIHSSFYFIARRHNA